MSIWVLSFYNLLRKLAVNEKIASVCGIILYFLLFLIIGFRYSVVRSGVMLIIMLVANFFERDYDSKSALGLAVLIICMVNPFSAMNNGFLMSALATLAILVIYPPLYELMTKPIVNRHNFFFSLMKGIASTAAVTISANIMLIPIYIFSIGTFPIISVVANLLIIALSSIIMVAGAMVGIFANVNILSDIFSAIAEYLGQFVLFVINKLSEIPFASINVSNNFFKVWLIASFLICAFALLFIEDKQKRLKFNALLCTLALFFSYVTYSLIEYNITKVDLLSKNNGFAVIVREEDTCVVIDYSGSVRTYKEVKRFLQKEFIGSIDFLVCESDSKLLKLDNKINRKVFIDKNQSFSLVIDDKVAINYFEKYEDSIYLEVGDISAVITSNTKTDYEKLPTDMQSADLLICDNAVPLNFKSERYKSILVAEKSDKTKTSDLCYRNAYSTANMSNITYRSTDDGNYEIRSAN